MNILIFLSIFIYINLLVFIIIFDDNSELSEGIEIRHVTDINITNENKSLNYRSCFINDLEVACNNFSLEVK